ncbi:MAG: hypothetical protein JWM02_2721 [Frankiales bacterium]|nr:hypothetical protein [Frankiales bacterium]
MPCAASGSPVGGVDRAAFVSAFLNRLRAAGVESGMPSAETFTRALEAQAPRTRSELYWLARVTLTHRRSDLAGFDAVFDALFSDVGLPLDPHARRNALAAGARPDDVFAPLPARAGAPEDGGGLPWATLPPVGDSATGEAALAVPERLPTGVAALADVPFDELDPDQLRLVSDWLEQAFTQWPLRRTRRLQPHPHGRYVDLRGTLARSRRSGWEAMSIQRSAPRYRPRRVVLLCDVSKSMQAHATASLHLMRAAVLTADAEVFAFATSLTRLTAVLAHRSADVAIAQATEAVVDRFGGTRIASNLEALLRSRHAGVLRGAVVIIASDGWDSDEPEALAAAMARLRRRAHRVVWMNPRVAAEGFAPLVGAMAAALPYCDELLPAHDLRALRDAVATVATSRASRGSRAGNGRR